MQHIKTSNDSEHERLDGFMQCAYVCLWAKPGACFGLQANAVGLAAALGSCQGQWLQSLSLQRWADGEIEVRRYEWLEGSTKHLSRWQDVIFS